MTADWTDGDSSTVGPNRPLYSAMWKSLCLGNLARIISQSGFRLQSIAHGQSTAVVHSFSDKGSWDDLYDEWGPWPVPVRHPQGLADTYRQIRVLVEGKCTYATGSTRLRIYALPGASRSLRVDADGSDPLPGISSYSELTFSGTSYTTQSCTITIDETMTVESVAAWSDDLPTTRYQEIALQGVVRANNVASETIYLRAPYIEEVP